MVTSKAALWVIGTTAPLLGRLRPITRRDRALTDELDIHRLGSGSVRTDRELAAVLIGAMEHGGLTVSDVLDNLPMHDEWTRTQQAEFLRIAVSIHRPQELARVESALLDYQHRGRPPGQP
ncbi:hypothetical protein [Mycobacterium servetii]|uniref:Uncharacterized protein n=1 Tax=Mycobacterium servetii TaxID=3237418 RepID=A0ABV4C8J3_9MYCO